MREWNSSPMERIQCVDVDMEIKCEWSNSSCQADRNDLYVIMRMSSTGRYRLELHVSLWTTIRIVDIGMRTNPRSRSRMIAARYRLTYHNYLVRQLISLCLVPSKWLPSRYRSAPWRYRTRYSTRGWQVMSSNVSNALSATNTVSRCM